MTRELRLIVQEDAGELLPPAASYAPPACPACGASARSSLAPGARVFLCGSMRYERDVGGVLVPQFFQTTTCRLDQLGGILAEVAGLARAMSCRHGGPHRAGEADVCCQWALLIDRIDAANIERPSAAGTENLI